MERAQGEELGLDPGEARFELFDRHADTITRLSVSSNQKMPYSLLFSGGSYESAGAPAGRL